MLEIDFGQPLLVYAVRHNIGVSSFGGVHGFYQDERRGAGTELFNDEMFNSVTEGRFINEKWTSPYNTIRLA
jgi:hypothetical protein